MSEVRQRREAPRAVADAVRLAKARRNAWALAGVAVFFYLGYMAWMYLRGIGG